MSFIGERVAYLKGLAEGMGLDDNTKESKLMKAMIEVLDDVAIVIDDIEKDQEYLSEQVDDVETALEELTGDTLDDDECWYYDDDDDDEEFEYEDGDDEHKAGSGHGGYRWGKCGCEECDDEE